MDLEHVLENRIILPSGPELTILRPENMAGIMECVFDQKYLRDKTGQSLGAINLYSRLRREGVDFFDYNKYKIGFINRDRLLLSAQRQGEYYQIKSEASPKQIATREPYFGQLRQISIIGYTLDELSSMSIRDISQERIVLFFALDIDSGRRAGVIECAVLASQVSGIYFQEK